MAKLWIMSDLHLESVPYPEAFRPDRQDFDVLVAAGDIWEGDCLHAFDFLAHLADGRPVIFVMGNHEHWNGALCTRLSIHWRHPVERLPPGWHSCGSGNLDDDGNRKRPAAGSW